MAVREILMLGNPKLFEICEPVEEAQLEQIKPIIQDLHDTLMAFRQKYNAGRAIAAPQIGAMKRLVYMHIEEPVVFINPVLDLKSTADNGALGRLHELSRTPREGASSSTVSDYISERELGGTKHDT